MVSALKSKMAAIYSSEDRYKIEQGGRRSSLFTGSKNRACDRKSRTDHGNRKWRVHTGTHRGEQHGQGRKNQVQRYLRSTGTY